MTTANLFTLYLAIRLPTGDVSRRFHIPSDVKARDKWMDFSLQTTSVNKVGTVSFMYKGQIDLET